MGGEYPMETVVTEVMVHPIMRRLLETNNSSNNGTTNFSAKFNPSMAIIIIVLISAFLFLGFFSIYLRRCTSSEERRGAQATQATRGGQPAPIGSPGQGLDREVVEALPLINYNLVKEVKGGKETTECAVCLSDFEDDEDLRLLPKCGHVFHPECIDMWFHSHSTCPLCRTTVMPDPEGKEGATYSEEFQAWTNSRGGGAADSEAVMIHDGPPMPPNGAILELLSREDADTLLAGSLRQDGDGMARREGDENGERAVEIRALNRALSNNSNSFRKALRTYSATQRMGSARFNSSSVTVAGVDGASAQRPGKNRTRSFGCSQSFNAALRRSSSVGSSGRYVREMMGMHTDNFSPGTQDSPKYGKSRIVGAYRVLNAPNKSNDTELRNWGRTRSVEIPIWDRIDLNGDVAHSPTSQKPGSGGRKFAELPPGARLVQVDLHDEASGQLYERRKGKECVEERTKSDRWTFGQTLRRSLRRTFSDSRDTPDNSSDINGDSGAKWYSHIMPPSSTPTSIAKKFASPWVAAMKIRRQNSGEIPSSPSTPSGSSFPQSLPVHDDHQPLHHQSLSIDEDYEQLHDAIPVYRGHQQQSQEEPPASPSNHRDNIQIVTQR